MEAIEFQTTISRDGTITVPDDLGKKMRNGKVRVIVIDDEPKSRDQDEVDDRNQGRDKGYIKYLMANPIKVDKSTPFLTRDEIYDR